MTGGDPLPPRNPAAGSAGHRVPRRQAGVSPQPEIRYPARMTKLRTLFAALLALGIMAGPANAQVYRTFPYHHGHHWHHPHFHRHGYYARPVYRRPPAVVVEPNLYGPHPY